MKAINKTENENIKNVYLLYFSEKIRYRNDI